MDDVSFFGENHAGAAERRAPKMSGRTYFAPADEAPEADQEEENQPCFMYCVAPIKDHARRHRHGEGGDVTCASREVGAKRENQNNAADAGQRGWQTQGPKVSTEQSLGNKQCVKVKGPVKIRGIVVV